MRFMVKPVVMKYLLFLSFCLLVQAAGAQETIHDPNAQLRTVGSFHAVEVSGGIDLYLSTGAPAVVISARDEESRNAIKTEVRNGVLYISYDYKFRSGLRNRALKAYVAGMNLTQLGASGGSDIRISGELKSDDLSIALSGGSDLSGQINVGKLVVEQSGGSDMNIKGRVGNLRIEASGGSDFNGYDLLSEECTIAASGGSSINITVNKELSAEASGGSDVSWKGSASVREAKASGTGRVSHRS